MDKAFFFVFSALLASLFGRSQASLDQQLTAIIDYRSRMVEQEEPSEIYAMNDSLIWLIENYLETDGSFDKPLVNVPYLADLYSPDKTFRMVNWNVPTVEGGFKYFAFVQRRVDKNTFVVTQLLDKSSDYDEPIYKNLQADEWYGALYYEIIPHKDKRTTYYILLGWDGATPMLNKKLIDVMQFTSRHEPKFGVTLFKPDKRMQRRVFFKYAQDANMSLRYHEKEDMIIFDHLVPMRDGMDGLYEFYGPSFSFNAFKRNRKGEWEFVEDVKPKLQKSNRQWNSPERKNLPTRQPK